jgi:ribosome maturation factor RimP
MVMELETPVRSLLADMNLDLYDIDLSGGTLHVTITREGGVDLEALTSASRALSAWLDETDPIAGHYTLDVASPGLERQLRTSAHFIGARGETVTLRERRDGEATRRLEGELVDANDETATLRVDGEDVVVRLDHVERARTVFAWGATSSTSTSKKG